MENTNWEKRFDKMFIHPFGDETRNAVWSLDMENEVKQFISSLLEQEKIKWLEVLPKEKEITGWESVGRDGWLNGWNDCLQTIKNNLK
jgi:hypothetical protein